MSSPPSWMSLDQLDANAELSDAMPDVLVHAGDATGGSCVGIQRPDTRPHCDCAVPSSPCPPHPFRSPHAAHAPHDAALGTGHLFTRYARVARNDVDMR
ncbi:hypothetical protein A0H81_12535 [Grifola frondosa]|uniref:Uncharacterized protein n=1 Tax=Grifola frondosa TaxID=5627 RepID=A0A1C7LRZ7_GRIFR|nr:hypothetical protein A0H81_12535 [Grifola frondosa]